MKNRNWSLVPVGLLLLTACGSGEHGHNDAKMSEHLAMMKTDSSTRATVAAQEAVFNTFFKMFNSGDLTGIEEVMAADFVDHQMDPQITSTGLQAVKDMLAMYHTAFPDVKQTIEAMSTTGDMTYVHYRITGTNTGPWGAMPATGKKMDVMGVDVVRFADGKAAEHWGYMEEMKMMTQLGLMPPPGEKKKK